MKSKAIKPHSAKLTKTETAHLAIKRAILRCEIPEGTFLSESAIMKRTASAARLSAKPVTGSTAKVFWRSFRGAGTWFPSSASRPSAICLS